MFFTSSIRVIKISKDIIQSALFYISDFMFMIRYSFSSATLSKDHSLAQIMLAMHGLEKGMSFSVKRIFGESKALSLTFLLKEHLAKYECDKVCKIAINILAEYLKNDASTKNEEVRSIIESFLMNYMDVLREDFAGTKKVVKPPYFNRTEIELFFETRSSVREYSNNIVTMDELKSAMKIASTTPTACNRQACRVHVFRDISMIKLLIDNQLGDQGWCTNATILFVITTNVSFFNFGYERSQPFIDGGLYAMNFVMGLHLNSIASCYKMFVREPKREREFKKIGNIPINEIPIVLILAGHYKEEIEAPRSKRIDEDDFLNNVICH